MPETHSILVLNAGSSSLKFSVFPAADGAGKTLAEQACPRPAAGAFGATEAAGFVLAWCRKEKVLGTGPLAAGHRVVHGGAAMTRPVRIDDRVLAHLETLSPLAPLHQRHSLAVVRAVAAAAPGIPQVACFDTSFHRTQPALAQAYALPREYLKLGVQRYGFHGLSYEHVAGVLATLDPVAAGGRTVIAHLGSGASLCALQAGRSIATTMGFSALDGLVMATRCGSIDPGVLLYLQRRRGLDADGLERLLYEESGLLGFSGVSGDMRALLDSHDPRAGQAIDLFVYRAVREIGSMAAALGGLDALVFTAGIGERAAPVRAAICRACRWLGVELDEAANERGGARISAGRSRATAWVIPTDEELVIARHTVRTLGLTGAESAPASAVGPECWSAP